MLHSSYFFLFNLSFQEYKRLVRRCVAILKIIKPISRFIRTRSLCMKIYLHTPFYTLLQECLRLSIFNFRHFTISIKLSQLKSKTTLTFPYSKYRLDIFLQLKFHCYHHFVSFFRRIFLSIWHDKLGKKENGDQLQFLSDTSRSEKFIMQTLKTSWPQKTLKAAYEYIYKLCK